jgi:hypothetical protein
VELTVVRRRMVPSWHELDQRQWFLSALQRVGTLAVQVFLIGRRSYGIPPQERTAGGAAAVVMVAPCATVGRLLGGMSAIAGELGDQRLGRQGRQAALSAAAPVDIVGVDTDDSASGSGPGTAAQPAQTMMAHTSARTASPTRSPTPCSHPVNRPQPRAWEAPFGCPRTGADAAQWS